MTYDEFKYQYSYIENQTYSLEWEDQQQKLLEYCRSVFDECKRTMNDYDLARMLYKYKNQIEYDSCNPNVNERFEVLELRQQVCHQLADKSFYEFGAMWADVLYERSIYYHDIQWTEDDVPGLYRDQKVTSALEDCEKAISIYQDLKRLYHQDHDENIAKCYLQAASLCEEKKLYKNAIDYRIKERKIYQDIYYRGIDNLVRIGDSHHKDGELCHYLGKYELARAALLEAIEAYTRCKGLNSLRQTRCVFEIGRCKSLIDSINEEESTEAQPGYEQ